MCFWFALKRRPSLPCLRHNTNSVKPPNASIVYSKHQYMTLVLAKTCMPSVGHSFSKLQQQCHESLQDYYEISFLRQEQFEIIEKLWLPVCHRSTRSKDTHIDWEQEVTDLTNVWQLAPLRTTLLSMKEAVLVFLQFLQGVWRIHLTVCLSTYSKFCFPAISWLVCYKISFTKGL